jgi:glycosyltransferase involved in cell wall biosynthesis
MPIATEFAPLEFADCPKLIDEPLLTESTQDPTAERVTHSLTELERLAELLAVEDGYDPVVRDFVIPRNFKLSIVIPVYNAETTIRQVIAHVAALPIPKEIIIVDDASTDGTRTILNEFECARDMHVIFKPHNEGRGAALRTGFRRVTGDVVVVQDAGPEYDPRDILAMVKPIVCGLADVVYGSRFLGDQSAERSPRQPLAGRLLTALSNWTTGLALTDLKTGYTAFRREVLQSFEIQQPRCGFEPEITARVARRKYRLYEVPVRYSPRGYRDGKTIGLADLLSALCCIVRYAWFG